MTKFDEQLNYILSEFRIDTNEGRENVKVLIKSLFKEMVKKEIVGEDEVQDEYSERDTFYRNKLRTEQREKLLEEIG